MSGDGEVWGKVLAFGWYGCYVVVGGNWAECLISSGGGVNICTQDRPTRGGITNVSSTLGQIMHLRLTII